MSICVGYSAAKGKIFVFPVLRVESDDGIWGPRVLSHQLGSGERCVFPSRTKSCAVVSQRFCRILRALGTFMLFIFAVEVLRSLS